MRVVGWLSVLGSLAFVAGAVAAAPSGPASPGGAAPSAPKASAPKAGQPQEGAESDLPAPAQIAWQSDVGAALKEAAKSGRVVLLAFRADWSQPCGMMERGTFGSKPIALYIERHFIPVRIDDSENVSPTSQTYHVRVYPTVLFLGPAGEVLHVVEGPRPPKEFQPILERVAALPGLIATQKQKPDDLEANFGLGNLFALLNQVSRAAPYLERAAQLDPANKKGRRSQARLILALAPLEKGNSAEALRLLRQFETDFKGAPGVPTAVFFQGAVLFQDGKLKEAREVFVRMQKEFPKHPKTYDADKAIIAIDGRLNYLERLKETRALPEKEPPAPAEKPKPKPKG